MSTSTQLQRLGYGDDLGSIVQDICNFFGAGALKQYSHLDEGYEDYNLKVQCDSGTFVVKLFANNQLGDYTKNRRGVDVADRLATILDAAGKVGIHSPQLVKSQSGDAVYRQGDVVAMMYQWIDGKTFYDIDAAPTSEELTNIIEQLAKIHSTQLKPVYYHDIWAVNHIHALVDKVKNSFNAEEQSLIDEVLRRFDRIPFEELPQCFVHGDFTKGNIIKTPDGDMYLIDFSVANWNARIVELALIASNLMFDRNTKRPLQERVDDVIAIYDKYSPLTDLEKKHLLDLAFASTAMEFLGGRWRRDYFQDNSEETQYWTQLGLDGLREAQLM